MERIKKIFFRIHILCWILCFLLLCFVFSDEVFDNWVATAFTLTISAAAVFYAHFYALIHYRGIKYLLCLMAVFTAGPLPFLLVKYGVMHHWTDFGDQYFTTMFSFVILSIFLSWVAWATENSFLKTMKTEILEKQAVQMELAYLKSQINPHFLFNTLNNIHSLVYTRSRSAPDAVMKLSSIMRYMLYESNVSTVSLKREIDYLLDYISLQQLRYKNFPIVDLEISGEIESRRIAPLLFIHLIENAYKHSRTRLEAGDIKIKINMENNTLNFSVENPVGNQSLMKVEGSGGFGLANLKKRLALIYPERHKLETIHSGEKFKVNLVIKDLDIQANEG